MPLVPLQQVNPILYRMYVESALQPGAQLEQTQAGAAASGASAARTTAEIPQVQAATNQLNILKSSGDVFSKKTDKQGYVSPDLYNSQKAAYLSAGGDSATFDKTYADNYVSPNNVLYDTPDAKAARTVFPIIKNIINSYHNLPIKGPEVKYIPEIPFIGQYLMQKVPSLAAAAAHNTYLMGQAGNIRQIAGAGPQQGFRFNMTELTNIINMLPNAYDSESMANHKLDLLDSYTKDNMGVGLKDLMQGGSQ